MGDGVRNGVEDEVLSVGAAGTLGRREERDGEKGREGGCERERKRAVDGWRGNGCGRNRTEDGKICPYDGARFAARKDFESKIDYHEVM